MTSPGLIRILLIDDHNLFRSGVRQLLQKEPDLQIVAEAADGLEGLKRAKALCPDIILLDLNMPGLSGLETLYLLTQDVPSSRVLILTVSEEAEELSLALRAGAYGYLTKNIEAETLVAAIQQVFRGRPVISETMTQRLLEQLRQPGQSDEENAQGAGGVAMSFGPASPAGAAAAAAGRSAPVGSVDPAAGAVRAAALPANGGPGRAAPVINAAGGSAHGGMDRAHLTAREREIMQCLARGESNKEIARNLGVAESTVKIHVQNILKKLNLSSRVQLAVYAVEHGLSGSLQD